MIQQYDEFFARKAHEMTQLVHLENLIAVGGFVLVVYYPRKPPFEEISTKSRLLANNPQTQTTNQIVQLGNSESPGAVACKLLET